MSEKDKVSGTITRAQGQALERRFSKLIDGLDAEEAEWLLSRFANVEAFIRRRPDDGLLTRAFNGTYETQAFEPRRTTLDAARLLRHKPSDWSSDERDEFFPGVYDGPRNFKCAMHAYAVGGPPYREEQMRNVPTGMARVAVDFRLRGFVLAGFHQLASFAAYWAADEMRTAEWDRRHGPVRIYALGSRARNDAGNGLIVPVMLAPGARDWSGDRHDARWRLSYERLDGDGWTRTDAWFLTVTPAD